VGELTVITTLQVYHEGRSCIAGCSSGSGGVDCDNNPTGIS
jgi:hypothetical protein